MRPGNAKGRPNGAAPAAKPHHTLHRSGAIDQMRALIADLDHWHREISFAFREGYTAGFQAGYEVGYDRRLHEETEEWRALADRVRAHAYRITNPEQAALDRAYAEGAPCNTPHPTGCSRCIRAAAVARRGGDYQGGPVEWDPQREPTDRPHLRLVRETA